MATPSSILAWKIPWTEEPGRWQSIGSQRVRHNDWARWFFPNKIVAQCLKGTLRFLYPLCSFSSHSPCQAEWPAVCNMNHSYPMFMHMDAASCLCAIPLTLLTQLCSTCRLRFIQVFSLPSVIHCAPPAPQSSFLLWSWPISDPLDPYLSFLFPTGANGPQNLSECVYLMNKRWEPPDGSLSNLSPVLHWAVVGDL